MRSGKERQDEEGEEEEYGTKKDASTSSKSTRDGKIGEKENAIRSKHSVTEQRRRSKINERFQILRELIPNSDQKRDTASFLLEVIQYLQFLQDKVQKYEGSYESWSSEPTKLMPWRNSHWRTQSFVGQTHSAKNGSGPGPSFPGRFEENCGPSPTTMHLNQHHPIEPELLMEAASCRSIEPKSELADKVTGLSVPLPVGMPVSLTNDCAFTQTLPMPASVGQSTEYHMAADSVNHLDELAVEGGMISISSAYSQGLLNSLTQALESTGLDLSQANISVQINLGKRANGGSNSMISTKDLDTSGNQTKVPFQDTSNCEDIDQTQKRLKI